MNTDQKKLLCLGAAFFSFTSTIAYGDPPTTQPHYVFVTVYPATNPADIPAWTIRKSIAGPQPVYIAMEGGSDSLFGPTSQPATRPATKPAADPAMDFFLNDAAKPATNPAADAPASQPAALVDKNAPSDVRPAVITLNSGKTITGNASTTADKPIRIWDDAIKDYHDIPFSLIKSVTAIVNWERDEPEWKFKESGSDVKEMTGRTYPARETSYEVVLLNGDKITGDVAAPIYIDTGEKTLTFVLHKRDKGDLGQKLTDLVYIKHIELK